ncbi:uncharacterized protein LOC121394539 [Xenopus laevis]|nr:uncharacterized protein LOC121394539 [Xenopus laevis]
MAEENPDGRLRDILRWIQAEAGHEDIQTLLQQCQLASSTTTAVTSLPTAEPPGSPSEEAASSSGAASDVAIQRTPASRGPGKRRIVAVKRNTRGKQAAKKRTQMTSAVSAKKRIVADPPQTGVWPSASPPSSRVSSAAVASGGPLHQKSFNTSGPFPSTGSGGGPAAGSSYEGHQVSRGPQSRPEPGPSSCNTIGHPVLPPAIRGHTSPSVTHSAPQPAGFTPQEESQPIQVIVQRALGNRQLFGQRRNTMPPTSVEFSIARISKWLSMSLADKTWHAYIASWNEWMKFKTSFPKEHYQRDSDVLLSFVLEQVEAQYSLSAITKKLAGISFFLKVQGEADITKSFLVKQILRGVGRITRSVDIRRPITLSLLKDLVSVLPQICYSRFETMLFTLLFSVSFFGALRVSESVSQSKRSPGGIGSEDIHLVEGKLKIILKKSKTDKVGRGTTIWLGNSTEQSICPVLAFRHYQQVRPCLPGPFFIHSDGSFLTRFQFVKILKGAVSKLGIPPDHYNTHSFRIGAATQASLMGLGEEFIKRLGRWNSSRYQLYVRPTLV